MDFGVLKAIRTHLLNANQLQDMGIKHISFCTPKSQDFPVIILEIEEIWTSMLFAPKDPLGKLRIKASVFSALGSGREALSIATTMRQVLDGYPLELESGYAISKLDTTLVDISVPGRVPTVNHFYDVLVRSLFMKAKEMSKK